MGIASFDPVLDFPLERLLELARDAGETILTIYQDKGLMSRFTLKQDNSPLTLADRASHATICRGLHALTPDIPILSEEGAAFPYEIRRHWERFWCIDPLDGTKEFLAGNGEFCVNIALIQRQMPVLGIIYIPVSQSLYYGSLVTGGWKITPGHGQVRIQTDRQSKQWIAVGSRSHASPEEAEILNRYPVGKHISAGSSLKFCLIADGSAHFYCRYGPTMEWDTAAGHAIVQYSGGDFSMLSGEPFLYNKESLVNGPFVCAADRTF